MNLFFFIVFLNFYHNEGSFSRIVGGYEAPQEYSKFHASLQNVFGNHVCGGAIISKQHIVTAAHCVQSAEPEHINVVVGTTNLDANGQRHNVSTITMHENFDFASKVDDIAILKIKGTFDTNTVHILKLYNEQLNEGDSIILTGFGAHEANGEGSRQMYALNLSVFDQETCRFAMRYVRDVHDDVFCTFTRLGEGTCHGDSGGPLVKDNQLAGIVSWGIPCAAGFPDVHTRISPYIEWIEKQVK